MRIAIGGRPSVVGGRLTFHATRFTFHAATDDGQQTTDNGQTPMPEPVVKVENLHKRYGKLEVLKGIDLQVAPREVVCLIGRSGSGKSTLLRCINFLEEPNVGVITVAGIRVPAGERTREHRRHIIELRERAGMVFQSFNLFPHKTVLENLIEAPLIVKKMRRGEAVAIAEELLDKVGLAEKRDVYPS